jgi:acyl-CoA thioester hydrolase
LNYFEQCRNDHARALGIDFQEYYRQGYSLVMAKVTVEYKRSLRSGDSFSVSSEVHEVTNKRVLFYQKIVRNHDNKLIATALVEVACVDHKTGRTCMPAMLKAKL